MPVGPPVGVFIPEQVIMRASDVRLLLQCYRLPQDRGYLMQTSSSSCNGASNVGEW
jgi:hypothetical protein